MTDYGIDDLGYIPKYDDPNNFVISNRYFAHLQRIRQSQQRLNEAEERRQIRLECLKSEVPPRDYWDSLITVRKRQLLRDYVVSLEAFKHIDLPTLEDIFNLSDEIPVLKKDISNSLYGEKVLCVREINSKFQRHILRVDICNILETFGLPRNQELGNRAHKLSVSGSLYWDFDLLRFRKFGNSQERYRNALSLIEIGKDNTCEAFESELYSPSRLNKYFKHIMSGVDF